MQNGLYVVFAEAVLFVHVEKKKFFNPLKSLIIRLI